MKESQISVEFVCFPDLSVHGEMRCQRIDSCTKSELGVCNYVQGVIAARCSACHSPLSVNFDPHRSYRDPKPLVSVDMLDGSSVVSGNSIAHKNLAAYFWLHVRMTRPWCFRQWVMMSSSTTTPRTGASRQHDAKNCIRGETK